MPFKHNTSRASKNLPPRKSFCKVGKTARSDQAEFESEEGQVLPTKQDIPQIWLATVMSMSVMRRKQIEEEEEEEVLEYTSSLC